MVREMIKAFLLIFIAEMGDKTQILAMAFATRFPVRKVLIGIGSGVLLNHGLAVVLGSYLSQVVPINTIQMIAGAAFIGFALWTLKPDEEEEGEKETRMKFGPAATVAIAFFLGELGDKTQLTAITLAADARYPLMVLAGTVSGMIATGALGIFVGKKLGDRIPETGIRLLAASIFMFFGLQKLYRTVPARYLEVYYAVPFIAVLALAAGWMTYSMIRRKREGFRSAFISKSKMLHDYYQHLKKDLDEICLGPEYCSGCQGSQCAVGKSKEVVQEALDSRGCQKAPQEAETKYSEKPFVEEKVLDCLVDTLLLISMIRDEKSLPVAHFIRNQMETILIGKPIAIFDDIDMYIGEVRKTDEGLSEKIGNAFRMRRAMDGRQVHEGDKGIPA
ncbi:MAG TPA: TMEM165/GDT1 family protein [Clostridiales bacterium]|nr:TMEM165/GDT1 family protein [Clostridiales bacterium]